MTTIKSLSRNTAAKTTEVLEAEMAGDVITALAQFVASRKKGEDRKIAISVKVAAAAKCRRGDPE